MKALAILLTLIMVQPVLADDGVVVEGRLAKKLYKTFDNYSDPVCDDEGCKVLVESVMCTNLGVFTCALTRFQGDHLVYTTLLGSKAKRLYRAMGKVQKEFCDKEYSGICTSGLSSVICLKSKERRRTKYTCKVS